MEQDDFFLEGTSILSNILDFFVCDVCVSSWRISGNTFSQLIFLGGEETGAGPLSDSKLLAKFWPSLYIFFSYEFLHGVAANNFICYSRNLNIRNSGFLDHAVCDPVVYIFPGVMASFL